MQAAEPPMRLAEALSPAGIVVISSQTTAPLLGQPAGQDLTDTVLRVRRAGLNVLDDHEDVITGTLRPGLAGRIVSLQVALRRGWRSVAWTRTGALGRFRVRYTPHAIGSMRVRLRFAGDVEDEPARRASRPAERLPPGGSLLVRRRRKPRVRRMADELDRRGGQQDAAVRHDRDDPLRRSLGARAGDRPRPVCRRAGIRPHRSDEARAWLRRHGRRLEHELRPLGRFVQRLAFLVRRR